MNILFGFEANAFLNSWREREVERSEEHPDCWESESLCRWQEKVHAAGYKKTELSKSHYGWGLRFVSGLDGFRLIHLARELGGSYEAAEEAARIWYLEDPSHRVVYTPREILDHVKANEPT